jgi:hypothetical protein
MKSLKRFGLGALLALVSTSVFAVDYTASLSVKDIKANPGGTGTIDIVLSNNDPEVSIIQFNLTVPEGVTPSVKNSAIEKLRNISTASAKQQDDGSYRYLFETEDEETFVDVDEEGSILVSIPVEFSSDFVGGEGKLTNIVIAGAKGHKDPSLVVSFNFTVGAETETVTLTKEYNTYVPTKALDFSGVEGIKAYYVTAVTATEATLTETTTVAAGEGIIISGTPDTYEVPVATTEVAKSTTNKLATGTIAEGDYILYDGEFVPCSGGTLPDGKAYLPKSEISTSSAKALILGFGDATGINEAKAAKADGAIYSISGVRVAQPQKGVYIMNGRKVIVK